MSLSFSIVALEGDLLGQAAGLIQALGESTENERPCRNADEFAASLREGTLGVCRQGGWTWILDPEMALGTTSDAGATLSGRLNVRVISCFLFGPSGDCGFHLCREGNVLRSWEHFDGSLKEFGEVLPEEGSAAAPADALLLTLRRFGIEPERLGSGSGFRVYGEAPSPGEAGPAEEGAEVPAGRRPWWKLW